MKAGIFMKDVNNIDDKRQRDFEDLQNEVSGLDVGRMQRFLGPDDHRSKEGKRKKAERERTLRTLQELLRDPEYAALFSDLGDRLRDAEILADQTLAALEDQLVSLSLSIDELELQAARDPQGQLVFRYADGRVVYADNTDVPEHLAEGVLWPENAPSAEAYFALLGQQRRLQEQQHDWSAYRSDVLGGIRHRYEDEENPMDKDDLRRALEDIEELSPATLELAHQDTGDTGYSPHPAGNMSIPLVLK